MTPPVLLIPAYRPAAQLPELVASILGNSGEVVSQAVVVDDGSGPSYAHVFDALRATAGVTVLKHAVNLGKGAALKTGFNFILASQDEVSGIVTADADGQHKPDDILRVATAHAENPEALILGSRRFEGEVPFRSRFGNRATRFFFHLFTGVRLGDTQTGLRVWPRALCLRVLSLPYNGYEFEFESLLLAAKLPMREVPIATVYEQGNASSHFNPMRDSLRIYFVFLRYSASALLAAVIDSGVFSLVLWRTGSLLTSQVAGRAAATVVAFFILRAVVFQSTAAFGPTFLRFLALVIVSGAVSLGLIETLTGFGVPPLMAKILAEGTLFVANFAVQRLLVFRRE